MESVRFFTLAYRVTAYEGVMAARAMDERQKKKEQEQIATQPQRLQERGAEVVAIEGSRPSYLHKRLAALEAGKES